MWRPGLTAAPALSRGLCLYSLPQDYNGGQFGPCLVYRLIERQNFGPQNSVENFLEKIVDAQYGSSWC